MAKVSLVSAMRPRQSSHFQIDEWWTCDRCRMGNGPRNVCCGKCGATPPAVCLSVGQGATDKAAEAAATISTGASIGGVVGNAIPIPGFGAAAGAAIGTIVGCIIAIIEIFGDAGPMSTDEVRALSHWTGPIGEAAQKELGRRGRQVIAVAMAAGRGDPATLAALRARGISLGGLANDLDTIANTLGASGGAVDSATQAAQQSLRTIAAAIRARGGDAAKSTVLVGLSLALSGDRSAASTAAADIGRGLIADSRGRFSGLVVPAVVVGAVGVAALTPVGPFVLSWARRAASLIW